MHSIQGATVVQEFNIQTDPEAAHVVFESGVPVAMVPIEVPSPPSDTRDLSHDL